MRKMARVLGMILLVAALLGGVVGVSAQEEQADAVVATATVLRSKPADPAGQKLEDLLVDEPLDVLGKTRNGNWLYVQTGSGAKGWALLADLTVNVDLEAVEVVRDGEVEIAPPPEPTATLLNDAPLRDTAHDVLGAEIETLRQGEAARILGRSRAGNYVYVETITGAKGWLKVANAEVNLNLDKLPVVRSGEVEIAPPAVEPTFTVTSETAVIDRPFSVSNTVEAVGVGRTGKLLGRTANANYYYVEMDSTAKGWLPADAVETAYPISRLDLARSSGVEIAEPPTPTAAPMADTALVDNAGATLETVPAGETVTVMGRTDAGQVYVETITGAKGLLPVDSVELSAPVDWLPIVAADAIEFAAPVLPDFALEAEVALRDRPFDTFNTVETLAAGRTGTLLGRTANGSYLYVVVDSGAKGWLSSGDVPTAFPASRLPVERSGQVEIVYPPTPTATLLADSPLRDRAFEAVSNVFETLRAGEEATVLGRTQGGNFLYVETMTGGKGWLAAADAELNTNPDWLPVVRSGEVEVAEPAIKPIFTVTGDAVLRDTAHDVVGNDVETLFEGRTGTLLGRTRAGNFYYVEMDSGAKGWLRVANLTTDYPESRLEILRSGEVEIVAPPALVLTVGEARAQVTTKPSATAVLEIDFIDPGQEVAVLGRTRNGNYLYVSTPTGARGWVTVESGALNVDAAILPVVRDGEVEILPGPMGFVAAAGPVNLRGGPSTEDEIRTVVEPGTQLRLLGRDASSSWLYVALPSGLEGWMAGFLIDTEFDVMTLDLFALP